ncbi:MAG TPA: tannase/feruloyl esterase family alpha/beta hydrolase, partial [Steroidobacteraceae bacterium]|nr:tannase/feruloyl esterase family alpha/beta hydrolase [Steroidobacteraceae bacterium]
RWARAAVALSSVLAALAAHANDCAALATVRLPHVRLTDVERIEATSDVPAYCRVEGEAQPTSDSQIGFELWLPEKDWNGRYYQLGSGGFAGSIHRPSLVAELRRGNAVAATDTGHRADSSDATWALGHPEKIVDYGYRSIRETSHAAKALVRDYYRKPARYSYFVGCSNGGRQALMAAQRFPEDWDGILAGAPALSWTRQLATFAWMQHAVRTMPADAALRVFREGPRDPQSGERLYFGFATDPDSDSRLQLTFAEQFFRNMVHDDPKWTVERFDGVRDFELAQQRRIGEATLSQVLDAVNPDLSAFERLRGKLLVYFGWADTLISPHVGVDYYERVVAHMGGVERTHRFFRLFMVPGMGHCQGGTAPHAFGQAGIVPGTRDDAEHDIRRALEAWVERGRAPERIVEKAQVLRPHKMGEQ